MTEKTFTALGVDEDLAAALADEGIVAPFPIQELTIPPGLSGADVIGQARTGTGKTLAFGLPLLHRLDPGAGEVQALVVTPTRELTIQVAGDLEIAGRPRDINVLTVYGGVAIGPQTDALRSGKVDVVVGTPGRLLDQLGRGNLDLSDVRTLVLDEADRMLDMGFLPDVERLIQACSADDRQTLLFSATMPGGVVTLGRRYMRQPTFIQAEPEAPDVPPETDQHFFLVHRMDKPRILARILQGENVGLAAVFVRTKRMADRLVKDLASLSVNATRVHGDLRQAHREKNLTKFRDGKAQVLVATEVAARGLDIEGVTHVVNYDCPDDEKMYLHRIGRTGRAGAAGVAVTFATHNEVGRVNVIRRAVGKADESLPEIFSTSDLLTDRFDLPDRTPWGHLGGTNGDDTNATSSKPKKSKAARKTRSSEGASSSGDGAKRDAGKSQRQTGDDSSPSRTRRRTRSESSEPSDDGDEAVRTRKRERSRPAARSKDASTTATSTKGDTGDSADDGPARSRTRTRDVEDASPSPSRTRRSGRSRRGKDGGGNERNDEDTTSDRRHRSARRTSDDAQDEPAGEPVAAADGRGEARPSLRRRVKVEHLP